MGARFHVRTDPPGEGEPTPPRRRQASRPDPEPAPSVALDPETSSTAAQVATFKTSRFQVGLPAAVLVALIAAVSSFAIAWINKPTATVALSQQQSDKLDQCAALAGKLEQYHQENQQFRNWIEPQIGVILVRLNAQPFPPPPAAQAPAPH